MKKRIAVLLAALLAAATLFAACGKTDAPDATDGSDAVSESTEATAASTTAATEVQMPNPMARMDGPEMFEQELGFSIKAPEKAEDASYYVVSGQIAEVNFLLDGHGYSLRASKAEGDISGLYGELVSEQPLGDGATLTTLKSGDADWYCLKWMNGDVQVALSNTDGAEIDALQAIYNEVK